MLYWPRPAASFEGSSMPYWFWSVLVIVLFLPVLSRVLLWMTILGLRFQQGAIRLASENEIPAEQRDLLRGADGLLAGQGFRFAGYAVQKDWIAGDPDTQYLAYYLHETTPCWAQVRAHGAPTPQAPFLIGYLSCFTNGKLLATRNLDPDLESVRLPYLENQFPFLASWDAAWNLHMERHSAQEAEARAERIPLEALIFLRNKGDGDTLDAMREKGRLVSAEGELQKPSLSGAWDMTRGSLRWQGPSAEAGQAWLKRPETYPLPHRVEAYSYFRQQRHSPRAGVLGKTLLVLASLGVYAFIGGKGQSWTDALVLLAVVFLHEMGHAVAMRAVGYRDVNIFFIPFFGAFASGKPTGAIAAWKEAVVLLAGPMPGLLLGAWLMTTVTTWLPSGAYQAGLMALVLNALNLLPFSPLDGGRLMELILFRKAPRIGQLFLGTSGLALLAMAFYLEQPILGAVGVVIAIAAAKTYPQAKLLAEWRKEATPGGNGGPDEATLDATGEPTVVAELFKRYRAETSMTFVQKAAQVKAILSGLHMRAPNPWGAAFLLLVYLGCWALPAHMLGLHRLLGLGMPVVLSRADLEPAELKVYNGFCEDDAVVDIFAIRIRDTLTLSVRAVSTDDTARLRGMIEPWFLPAREDPEDSLSRFAGWKRELRGGGWTRIGLRAPLWSFRGLDSSLGKDLVWPYGEDDEYHWEDLESDTLPPSDSALQAIAAYEKAVDSLRAVEAGIWRLWTKEKRADWVDAYARERLTRGDTLRCWKSRNPRVETRASEWTPALNQGRRAEI